MLGESMSGYGIEDVPTIQMESDASSALDGSDSVQESLMAEAVIQVTEHDEVIGPISKLDSHFGVGKYHRAFSVLLFDSSGRLLLQKRENRLKKTVILKVKLFVYSLFNTYQ